MDWKKIKVILKFPIFEAVIFALLLAVDLVSKHLAAKNGVDTDVLGAVVRFEYVENTGAAFSLFGEKSWAPTFFIVLSCLVIPAIGAFLYFSRKNGIVCRVALTLIIAGAVGNFVDRVFLGYVRDFIDAPFIFFFMKSKPIFNFADACLTVGIVMFLVFYIFLYKDPKKKAKDTESEIIEKSEMSDTDANAS